MSTSSLTVLEGCSHTIKGSSHEVSCRQDSSITDCEEIADAYKHENCYPYNTTRHLNFKGKFRI